MSPSDSFAIIWPAINIYLISGLQIFKVSFSMLHYYLLVTRSTLVPLVVLVYSLIVLAYSLVVLVCLLVVVLVCLLVVLVCPLVVSVCPLIVLLVHLVLCWSFYNGSSKKVKDKNCFEALKSVIRY